MAYELRGRPLSLWLLLGLTGTLGIRGIAGGGQFLLVPSGDLIGVSTTVLAPTPVTDFLVPGAFLFVALGVAPLFVLYGLFRERPWARRGALAVGTALVGWAIVEGIVLGFGGRLQHVNLLWGIAMVVLAAAPGVRSTFDARTTDSQS